MISGDQITESNEHHLSKYDSKCDQNRKYTSPIRVFGCESKCLVFTMSRSLIFSVGKYVVLQDLDSNKQRIFDFHISSICAIGYCSKLDYVASACNNYFFLWSASNFDIHFTYPLERNESILALKFSSNGNFVFAHVNNVFKTDAVWLFNAEKRFLCRSLELSCKFKTWEALYDYVMIVDSSDTISFWILDSEVYRIENYNEALDAHNSKITVLKELHNRIIASGCESGFLTLWDDRKCIKYSRAHKSAVTMIEATERIIVAGYYDAVIVLWSPTLEMIAKYDLNSVFRHQESLATIGIIEDRIFVASNKYNIIELLADDGSIVDGSYKSLSHHNIITGLAVNNNKKEVVTCSKDGTLRIWSLVTNSNLRNVNFRQELRLHVPLTETFKLIFCNYCRCVDINKSGCFVAVGLCDSKETETKANIIILDYQKFSVNFELRNYSSSVCALKFSHNDELLAAVYADGCIHIYSVNDNYSIIAKYINKDTTGIAFSVCNGYLKISGDEVEIIFDIFDNNSEGFTADKIVAQQIFFIDNVSLNAQTMLENYKSLVFKMNRSNCKIVSCYQDEFKHTSIPECLAVATNNCFALWIIKG